VAASPSNAARASVGKLMAGHRDRLIRIDPEAKKLPDSAGIGEILEKGIRPSDSTAETTNRKMIAGNQTDETFMSLLLEYAVVS
jgi:hypothetical protein